MATVEFQEVSKRYQDGTEAVQNLSLEVKDGELMVLVGPSGCGKTSALRMVAGLEDISDGKLKIGGTVVNDRDCSERDIAMVFQNYALYPHMTVARNLEFPLRMAGIDKSIRRERVERVASMLGIEPYLQRHPARLSGGQRQRVAMGRALVREPQVFLMDEPLSNLDAKLRTAMRSEISSLQRQLGITTLYVTHDQVEALTMGDRVAVMRNGILQQAADPRTLYVEPANLFVAAFIGSPPMSLVEGDIERVGSGAVLHVGPQRLTLTEVPAGGYSGPVVAGFRPESFEYGNPDDGRSLSGTVQVRESIGSDLLLHIALSGSRPLSQQTIELAHLHQGGDEGGMGAERESQIVARLPPSLPHRLGDSITVSITEGAVYLFDPRDGRPLMMDRSEFRQSISKLPTSPA